MITLAIPNAVAGGRGQHRVNRSTSQVIKAELSVEYFRRINKKHSPKGNLFPRQTLLLLPSLLPGGSQQGKAPPNHEPHSAGIPGNCWERLLLVGVHGAPSPGSESAAPVQWAGVDGHFPVTAG